MSNRYWIDKTDSIDTVLAEDFNSAFDTIEAEMNSKVDKAAGKGLSTNDFTDEEKDKLAGIEEGANKTVVDDVLMADSVNPVQNKVVNSALQEKADILVLRSETGESFVINDSVERGVVGLNVYGESTQDTERTESINMLMPVGTSWAQEDCVITYDIDTGIFTVSGNVPEVGTEFWHADFNIDINPITYNETNEYATFSVQDISETIVNGTVNMVIDNTTFQIPVFTAGSPDLSYSKDVFYEVDPVLYSSITIAVDANSADAFGVLQFKLQFEKNPSMRDWQLPNGTYPPRPNVPVEIVNTTNPTITLKKDELDENPQTVTLNGITLKSVKNESGSYVARDYVVVDCKNATVKLVKNCHTFTTTSQTTCRSNTWNVPTGLVGYVATYSESPFITIGAAPLCSHFIAKAPSSAVLNSVFGDGSTNTYFVVSPDEYPTVESFNAFLQTNNVEIVHQLFEPIETDITDTEVGQALLGSSTQLHTYYPDTTIISDTDCMVTYKADSTNAYNNVKSELDTLKQAIINIGGNI